MPKINFPVSTCLMWHKPSSNLYSVLKTRTENRQVFFPQILLISNCKASDPLGWKMKWETVLHTGKERLPIFHFETQNESSLSFLIFFLKPKYYFLYFLKYTDITGKHYEAADHLLWLHSFLKKEKGIHINEITWFDFFPFCYFYKVEDALLFVEVYSFFYTKKRHSKRSVEDNWTKLFRNKEKTYNFYVLILADKYIIFYFSAAKLTH